MARSTALAPTAATSAGTPATYGTGGSVDNSGPTSTTLEVFHSGNDGCGIREHVEHS